MTLQSVKMSIVTADTCTVESHGRQVPCVMLIGRGEDFQRLKRRIPFYPYFYLLEEDYQDLKKAGFFDSMHVVAVEGSPSRSIMKRLLTKITVEDAGRIGDNIHMVNKASKQKTLGFNALEDRTIYTYEADLGKSDLLPLRWMVDNGIKCGVEITGNKYKPIDFSVPLRKWFLDFEAYTLREYTSGMNPEDYLIMVSIWDSYEQKMYTLYVINEHWKPSIQIQAQQKADFLVSKQRFSHEVLSFRTEAQFLDALMDLKLNLDPDLIIAWNLNRYDIEKWKQRCDVNQGKVLHQFRDISPMLSVLWHSKPHRVKGMVLFDLMVAFKQFTDAEMDSYSLGYVTEKEHLGIEKIPFTGSSGNTWDNYPETMFKRNMADVMIMKALDDKYGLIETYDESRKEFGCLFHESFVRNRVIDSALLRMTHGKVVLGTPRYGEEASEKLLGAVVKEPHLGDNYWIAGLDLSRDYPSIIKGFNISPETYREKEPKQEHYTIHYEWVDEKNPVLGTRKFTSYFLKRPIGLLPQLILRFDEMRSYYQKEMATAILNKEPDYVIRKWERRQYNIKKTTNAIYGVMDFAGFRLMRKECTQAVAILGRITIEEMVKFLDTKGYEVCYADTDSNFIKLKSSNPEDCLKEGQELQVQINEHLTQFFEHQYNVTAHAELGLKAIYKKVKFLAKKLYAGKVLWDEKKFWIVNDSDDSYDIKGVSSVRSDASALEKLAMKEVLKMSLDDADPNLIQSFQEEILKDFDERHYSPMDISYPMQIKDRLWFDQKKQCWCTEAAKLDKNGRLSFPSHVRSAIYDNVYLNTDFTEGDKPRRLPIKFPKKFKVSGFQQTLFKETVNTFPSEWTYKGHTGGIKEDVTIKVKDISIVEDFNIPEYFLGLIDWERIRKRLVGKLNKLQDPYMIDRDEEDEQL